MNNLFDSLWFVVSTITTVGYGDVLPSSDIGRIIGLIILTFGVFIFSAVTGAMASYFTKKVFTKDEFNITENDENIKTPRKYNHKQFRTEAFVGGTCICALGYRSSDLEPRWHGFFFQRSGNTYQCGAA